ncbi:MAG TPA: hypothetical protein VHP83_23960 [Aggregatilineaceae bacterium]|nr:hypothetical protein [Aggregatilineaceae bacterium]
MVAVAKEPKQSRVDEVFVVICEYARANSGITPTTRELAKEMKLSQQRMSYVLMRLESLGRIKYISRYAYKVVDSEWMPPPNAEV